MTSIHDKRKQKRDCLQNFPDKMQLPWAAYSPPFYEVGLLSSWSWDFAREFSGPEAGSQECEFAGRACVPAK